MTMKEERKIRRQLISEILMHGLWDEMGDGISIQDTEFKILYQNKIHKNFIGDHVGKYCYKAYEQRDHVCEGCPVAEAFKDGEIHTAIRTASADTGMRYFEITASSLRDSKGKIIAGLEIVRDITMRKKVEETLQEARDKLEIRIKKRTLELEKTVKLLQEEITERKQVEDKLQESENKYRQLFSNELDAILIFDADSLELLDVNKAAVGLYGYSKEEFLQLKITDISAELEKTIETVAKTRSGNIEMIPLRYHKKKDGTIFPVEISPATFMLRNRKTVCGIIRDITERMEAEKQLHLYQERLRALISKLSVIEEQERNNIAEALHDNIGQYLALSKIKLAKLRKSYPVAAKELEEIRKLIEQTMEFTRSLTFELSTPILYRLGFKAAVIWFAEKIQKQHSLTVECICDETSDNLEGDINILLFKTVRELLYNIVKHAHAQKAVVSISSKGNNMKISVKDNGTGFDIYKIETYSIENKSFGILNIRERIRYLGGAFEIKSKPGHGTHVTIVVPIEQKNQ